MEAKDCERIKNMTIEEKMAFCGIAELRKEGEPVVSRLMRLLYIREYYSEQLDKLLSRKRIRKGEINRIKTLLEVVDFQVNCENELLNL